MRLPAIKPKILADKIRLAVHIRNCWKADSLTSPSHGCYWYGEFSKDDLRIYVYFQCYVHRLRVNYIHLRWLDLPYSPALTVADIKRLIAREKIGAKKTVSYFLKPK